MSKNNMDKLKTAIREQGFNEEEEEEHLIGQDEEGETDAIIEDEDLIEEELF